MTNMQHPMGPFGGVVVACITRPETLVLCAISAFPGSLLRWSNNKCVVFSQRAGARQRAASVSQEAGGRQALLQRGKVGAEVAPFRDRAAMNLLAHLDRAGGGHCRGIALELQAGRLEG